jgi:glycosyltransferase involved in cell wall biosynthesis
MHVLFIHRAFPAQFGQPALELTRRYGWTCSFLVEHLSRCPSPSTEMMERLQVHVLPPTAARGASSLPWPRTFGDALGRARTVAEWLRARPDLRLDLVVGHGGLIPTALIREVLNCPVVDFCEYYFALRGRDLTFRLDLPPAEPAPFYPRTINAAALFSLEACDAAYAPTCWQRDSFPERFRRKIAVHADGVDMYLYRPGPRPGVVCGRELAPDARVVTYTARGLESMRGFDLFMRAAREIARRRSDVYFIVVGEEATHYGWDLLHTSGATFKQWVLNRGDYDLSRFLFAGHIEPAQLAEVLRRSDLHIYWSVPFVVSWSLLDALASGCVVLAADTEAVREFVEPGANGLVEPFYDGERFVDTACRILADPAAFRPLGETARRRIEATHRADGVLPGFKAFLEQAVAGRNPPKKS